MSSMRRGRIASACCSARKPIGSMAASNGRPVQTPAERRKVRRFMGMTKSPGSFAQEHRTLHHVVNQRAEAILLLTTARHELLDHFAIRELDIGAGGVDQ